jgi:hypothetical protein
MKPFYLFTICIVLACFSAKAQNTVNKLVNADFKQARIEEVVSSLETQSGYHFYYDPAKFDSLRVTLQVTAKPLDEILRLAFNNTNYHFAIANEQVFLTRGQEIRPDLAAGYFGNTISNTNTHDLNTSGYNTTGVKEAVRATTENKVYTVGVKTAEFKPGKAILAGYVRDIKTGEAIVGASLYIPVLKTGVSTDPFGFYSISVPRGRYNVTVRGLGMKDTRRQLELYDDGRLNIDLQEQVTTLKEVKISADKIANVRSTELGVTRLDIQNIKQVPAVFGEPDVLRVVTTLPGVQTVGEATTGFNVRGGAADQNLILLNDATIYNPAHFFGFFSSFDPDIVKSVELYKSSIPEKYGGRLSSVLEVLNREGNKNKFTGSAGIGLITSRLSIEGPIDSGKTSFIFGGRTTYANWLLNLLPQEYKNSKASFYDFSLGLSHQINEKNNIYINGYLSNDAFRLNSDTTYGYSNKNLSAKWKHNFNNKFYGVFTGGVDNYQYNIENGGNPVEAYKLNFDVNQKFFKTDFTYYLSPKHTLDFGLSSILYKLHPGTQQPVGAASLVVPVTVSAEQALESALYLGDKYDITDKLSLSVGLRYSIYNYLGPQLVRNYAPNLPRQTINVLDSTNYSNGKFINTYHGPEIRVSARYLFNDEFSVKAGYNTLRQYIHLLSNTTAISPTDVYKLSDPNIRPQLGDQISLGLYKNFKSNTIETSVEVYYKRIKDYLDYRSGAVLVLNPHIETDVLETRGKAYGAEFLIRKNAGKLNGWMSYTYSRTFLRQNNANEGELINGGAYYPANYDKPHSFNFTGNYRFSHRYSASLNVVYSTGRPITLPLSKYDYAGSERIYYSDRNAYRIPDYFRSDFSINIEGNHRVHQFFHNSWSVGVYNLTGRQNAYSTFFIEQGGAINGYKLSIFAKPIPFINYNIRF